VETDPEDVLPLLLCDLSLPLGFFPQDRRHRKVVREMWGIQPTCLRGTKQDASKMIATTDSVAEEGYSPKVGEETFSEVRVAEVQHVWAYLAEISCPWVYDLDFFIMAREVDH
jgi:hypothetical protein